jgi:hypothetical protein
LRALVSVEGHSATARVLLEFGRQCFVVDPESLGGLGFVSSAGLEDAFNVQAFDLVEGQLCLVME